MKRLGWLLFLIFSLCVAGCGGSRSGSVTRSITVKGSDTMVILGQRWAETYMKLFPNERIQVTGGGSGTGIADINACV